MVRKALTATVLLCVWLGSPLAGQIPPPLPDLASPSPALELPRVTRVADPKLAGGVITAEFTLTPGALAAVTIQVLQGTTVVRTLQRGVPTTGRAAPFAVSWDGRDDAGRFASPGRYELTVSSNVTAPVSQPVDVVRLGITEIAARTSAATTNEWQMVYFKKATAVAFFATPAIHEYLNVAETGELSELDLDTGDPRPPVPPHRATDQPLLEGSNYEDDAYNYPLCYQGGAAPVLAVKFGATCVGNAGNQVGVGYPLAGIALRCIARENGQPWENGDIGIAPGTAYAYRGTALPDGISRTDLALEWSWEWSDDGGFSWTGIPGSLTTQHRLYTILAPPVWATGAVGTQYSGPWVEVVDDAAVWQEALGLDSTTATGVIEVVIKGFAGQIGPLTTAIEGVRYDCYPLGGDGGANHYTSGNSTQLSRLLDNHSNGVFVNCSDCASCTSVMISMLGVPGMQVMLLGSMTLYAIRGIGAPAYTLSLWGTTSPHRFGFHRIITRDRGVHVADACLWVDEDGNQNALPGVPGYNVDRPWNTGPNNYASLLASTPIVFQLEVLPFVQ